MRIEPSTLGRSLALAAILWLGLGALAGVAAQELAGGPAKVGVIDVRRILTESKAGRTALDKLRELAATKQADLESREQEATALREQLEAGRLSLSEERQEDMEQELQAKMIALSRAEDDARREIEESQIETFGEIEERVMPLIQAIGQEQGFTLIFNKYEDSGLLFAAPAADITDLVLQRFDALPQESQPEG